MIIYDVEEKSNQNYVYFLSQKVHYFCSTMNKPLKSLGFKDTETVLSVSGKRGKNMAYNKNSNAYDSTNAASNQSSDKTSNRTSNKTSNRASNKTSNKSTNKTSNRMTDRATDETDSMDDCHR